MLVEAGPKSLGTLEVTDANNGDKGHTANPGPDEQYDKPEIERLWAHLLHEDNMFIQVSNFFLVAESLLLVAFAGLYGSRTASPASQISVVNHIIAGFGLGLTAMWALINYRHLTYMNIIKRRVQIQIREYRHTRLIWQSTKNGRWWHRFGTYPLMGYAVPTLAAVMWCLLLAIV